MTILTRPRKEKRTDKSPSPKKDKKKVGWSDVNVVDTSCLPRSPSPCPMIYTESQFDRFTLLVASLDYIYEVTKGEGLYLKPNPLSRTQMNDRKNYCSYHESSVDHTYECRQLKGKLSHEYETASWKIRLFKK